MAYLKYAQQKNTKKPIASRRVSVSGRNLFLVDEVVVERGFEYFEPDTIDINAAPPVPCKRKFISNPDGIEYKECAVLKNLCTYDSSDESEMEESGGIGEKCGEKMQAVDVQPVQPVQPNNENQISLKWETMLLYSKPLPKLVPIQSKMEPDAVPSFRPRALKKPNTEVKALPGLLPLNKPMPNARNCVVAKALSQALPVKANSFNMFNPFRRLPNMPFTLTGRQRAKSVDCRLIASQLIEPIQPIMTQDRQEEVICETTREAELSGIMDSSDSIGPIKYDGSSEDNSSFTK